MKINKVINYKQLINDGATGINVELYQRALGRCRLFWYSFDQDGCQKGTIASFFCNDWKRAIKLARKLFSEYLLDMKTV